MFVGHYGPSFAIRVVRPEIPLWVVFVAAAVVSRWVFHWRGANCGAFKLADQSDHWPA